MAKPTRLTRGMIDDYLRRGYWDQRSISDILLENAKKYPNDEAVVDPARRLTWSQLNKVTSTAAVRLRELGIERDQAIVIQVPTPSTSLLFLLACHRAGLLCCFLPMTFRLNETRHVIRKLGAVASVTPITYRNVNYLEKVRKISLKLKTLRYFFVTDRVAPEGTIPVSDLTDISPKAEPGDRAWQGTAFSPFEVSIVVLSSGTTGIPKCIEHTGASCKAGGWGVVERARLTHGDIIGNIAPISGGPGLQNWWAAFQIGAKTCALERFSPEAALELIEKERVTYLAAIPTQLVRMLREAELSKYDLSSLRIVRTGAAAFDFAMARETEERLKCKVLVAGGSQETYSFAQSSIDDPLDNRLKTLGKPFPGNEVKIVDEKGRELPAGEIGELRVRGAATSSGYHGEPEATIEAWGELGKEGWYRTGDIARIDNDGYLVLVGRKKEMILRGGQNIFPGEIEELLVSHPRITQAVVIGVPDPIMGERACACITLVPGDSLSFEEMVEFLRAKGLAIHKLPERLEILDEFPHLADGQKVDKISLKKMILKRLDSAAE
ncbi:MAG: AMP-binding protein [Deltaproteobacteria bacterium]|nr:AMP-binding protein [Deltaproteobacteria bacterium]